MPTTPPPLPSSPNLSDSAKKPDRVLTDGNGNRVWAEIWLQQTWDQEWSVDSQVQTVGPSIYTGPGPTPAGGEPLPPGRYCRKTLTRTFFRQPMGLYYFYGYKIEKSWSGLEIFGAVLVGVAVIATLAVGGAVWYGAAWAVTTVAGVSTVTAVSTSILTAAGTLVAAGGVIVAKAEQGESKGARISGSEGYLQLPLGASDQYHSEVIVVQDWHTC
jgi:hypothetical protein